VVAEFNRYNLRKLTIADAETAAIVVGGNFRADKVDSFVRLLDSGFGVSARPDGNQIVLSRTR
jgi:transmembrane sensor